MSSPTSATCWRSCPRKIGDEEPAQDQAVIGYYVHHQGSGHLHRALSLNRAWTQQQPGRSTGPMTGLSTHTAPTGWCGDWIRLADDDGSPHDAGAFAHGRLHYVPYGNEGLLRRTAAVSAWIERTRPSCLVVDVSVEIALLARLHGIPVVVVAQPGRRHDAAHRLAYDIAEAIIAPWPAELGGLWGATPADLAKTHFVGAIGRFAPAVSSHPASTARVLVLNGTGGEGVSPAAVAAARRVTADTEWIHLDRTAGTWVDDPWPLLQSATVVISHAGQNAIAEIAAARRPALLLPQKRPFAEQQVMAAALAEAAWVPARIRSGWPDAADWPRLLAELRALDGAGWARWNDGGGADRAARVLTGIGDAARSVASGEVSCAAP